MTLPIQHCLKIYYKNSFFFTLLWLKYHYLIYYFGRQYLAGTQELPVVVDLLQVALSMAYITGRDPEMCGL